MRAWLALLVAIAGCGAAQPPAVGMEGSGAGEQGSECTSDHQCLAAGTKCCDCPTFAVPAADLAYQACIGLPCPSEQCPGNVRAACDEGRCVLACVAMECQQSCANGFATDASGCLTCACAEPVADGCTQAADCVRVRADCCGCERGGHATAVLKTTAARYDESLMCDAAPQCPVVNTCDAATTPQCIQGRCELTSPVALPPNACGRADLAPCPPGQVCVVNGGDAIAMQQGVGVCSAAGA